MLGSLKQSQIQNSNYSGWVAGLSGNIDHLNPIEVEVEVGLGLSLAIYFIPNEMILHREG